MQRTDDDGIAIVQPLDAGADGGDTARHLVPDDAVVADAGVHVAVEDMHVGAADADEGHVDRHLAGARLGGGDRFDGEVPVPAVEGCLLGHGKGSQWMAKGARRAQSNSTPVPGVSGAMQCSASSTSGRVV